MKLYSAMSDNHFPLFRFVETFERDLDRNFDTPGTANAAQNPQRLDAPLPRRPLEQMCPTVLTVVPSRDRFPHDFVNENIVSNR